ncbi:ATP synthase subunit I [Deinococcus saxicola]|uniref:hypothetical protein n=1 Tax=Deinococcus saxicola TaxID=249406 RepID=UPI0039F032D8
MERWIREQRYRYEALLGAGLLTTLLWPLYAGFPGFVAGWALLLIVLDARSTSQFKRSSEDTTMMDQLLGKIPFRYEVLAGLAMLLWAAWWYAAGMTGFVFGLGVFTLTLRARSSSQLKRGAVLTGETFA